MRRPFSRPASASLMALAAMICGLLALAALPTAAHAMLLPINHAERIDVRGLAASVVVGNTSIASVTVVDAHTLYIMGRGAGSTNVVVLDKSGRTLFSGDVTVGAAGARVSLYRGDKRTEVNCSYGCVETGESDKQPGINLRALSVGAAGAGMMASAPGPTGP